MSQPLVRHGALVTDNGKPLCRALLVTDNGKPLRRALPVGVVRRAHLVRTARQRTDTHAVVSGREETPSVIEKTEVPRLGTDWIAILEHPASWVFAALLAVIGVGLAFSDMLDHAPGGAKTEAGKRMAAAGLKYTDPFDCRSRGIRWEIWRTPTVFASAPAIPGERTDDYINSLPPPEITGAHCRSLAQAVSQRRARKNQ